MSNLFASERTSKVIQVIDDLRNNGLANVIELPRICVVGAQSTGKSSVLEAVVGTDFLPKAKGLCTRCPLEVRIRRDPSAVVPFAFFHDKDNTPSERITDFSQVVNGIVDRTNVIAGDGSQIVGDAIVLEIHQKDCLDLTLIDLPGVTKFNSDTEEIEALTRGLSHKYISESRTIILAVMPMNDDVTNSEALLLARKVDQEGKRTIGVVTKIDQLPAGTDPAPTLLGKTFYLEHGYIGVMNRNQQQLTDKMSIEESLQREKTFIENNEHYNKLPSDVLGVPILRTKLSNLLQESIREHLPDIRKEVRQKMKDTEAAIAQLGAAPRTRGECNQLMLKLIHELSSSVDAILHGRPPQHRLYQHMDRKVILRAKFRPLYVKLYCQPIATANGQDTNCVEGAYFPEDEALQIYTDTNFNKLPDIHSEESFRAMCVQRFKALEDPADTLIDDVHDIVTDIIHAIIKAMDRAGATGIVSKLTREIAAAAAQCADDCHKETLSAVRQLLKCETNVMYAYSIATEEETLANFPEHNQQLFVHAHHNEYHQVHGFVHKDALIRQRKDEESERHRAIKLRDKTIEYMEHTRMRLRDSLPRVIHQHYVVALCEKLPAFITDAISIEAAEELLREPHTVAHLRAHLEERIGTLQRSEKVLKEYTSL